MLRALLFWLALFESTALRKQWRGLSWSGGALDPRVMDVAALGLLASLRGHLLARFGWLAASLPLAVVAQAGVGSLRNRTLTPLARFQPGTYERATVTAYEIPMNEGHLPALLVEPKGGAQKAVCVLHGSGGHRTSYAWVLADALNAAGCAALLVDMDGHGQNPRPQRFPQMLEDPQVGVAWLRERYSKVGALGISLGGCVTARAVADGLAVDRVAVLESPPKLSFNRADMWREGFALPQGELLGLFTEITPLNLYRAWNTSTIRAEISTWDLIDRLDLLGSVARISEPLLLVYGGRDAIAKPALARQVEAAAPPQARFVFVPHASHLTLQLLPSAMNEVREWFAAM